MLQIKNDEHVFICGMTGSGKTHFAMYLYSLLHDPGHIVVLDVKHDISLPYAVVVHRVQDILLALNEKKNVIARLVNSQENYDAVAQLVYARGNTILWIDEGAQIVPEGKITQPFVNLYTAGRSRKAVCWTLSQRPAIISKTGISQSSHYFIFALILSRDKKAICEDVPLEVEQINALKKRWFYHYMQGDDAPKLFPPISKKL